MDAVGTDVDLVLLTAARTIVDHAEEFAQLDAVAGDGDFGFSLRAGFEVVLADYESFDHSSVGALLKKIGFTIAGKVGGVSGPIWGTAFMRAGAAAGDRTELTGPEVVEAMRAAVEGVKHRGQAEIGDKTLLDALVPAIDALEAALTAGDDGATALQHAADAAVTAAEGTLGMLAKRGRAAYTGERSRDSVDAGATAIGVILQAISAAWRDSRHSEGVSP
ncbi:dihydroxyacetone kinase subunit L [Pseudactinotalea sp. HY160]|uniref:dihydroxyacetone kinase subunit DhaL n=1 Tax=Pseudactinotalea sp. HY160 TaxID=2654490 RepID=UPI00128D2CB9|nr:dihydroxyacetone kinase subunit DhaL [Pseudactinotalea sp. HY160]MPV49242.1 dihydroxyacetone kinase subunit L [Pseudactinotalea sp. HY160]